jgi:hypothetical protein
MAACCAAIICQPVANSQSKPGLAYGPVQTGGRPGGLVLAGRVTPSGLDAAPGRKPSVPLVGGNYFQPQAVLYRRGRKLTPLMKEFIEFLKQPEPDFSPMGTGDALRPKAG